MSSKRKTGPAHVARKRKRRKPVDLYAIARRSRMPVAPGDLDGMSVREVRLAAQAYRRMNLRRSLSEILSSLMKDALLTNAFHKMLTPRLLFRQPSVNVDTAIFPGDAEANIQRFNVKTADVRVLFTLGDLDREDD